MYSHLGANKKLSLTGRPKRPIGAIGTSKVRVPAAGVLIMVVCVVDIQDIWSDDCILSYRSQHCRLLHVL